MLIRGLLTIVMALGLMFSVPAVNAQEAEQQFEPDVVEVYGRTITVQPFQMDQTGFTWEDMKSWLPQEISQTPETPMSYQEIYLAVSDWAKMNQEEYEAGLDKLTKDYLLEKEGEDYTEMDYDIQHKIYSDMFHIPGGDQISQETYEAHHRYLACLYLKDMLREAFKYDRDRFE